MVMQNWIKTLLIFLLFSPLTQSQFGITISYSAVNVCPDCTLNMQREFSPEEVRQSAAPGSTSILVVGHNTSTTNYYDPLVKEILQDRILLFSARDNSFVKKLVNQAKSMDAIKFKLYYQLAIDSVGNTAFHDPRNKPIYEIEKAISHELWGYYQTHDGKAYVLVNEYQNLWNADYTAIHELFHLLDLNSENYWQKIILEKRTWQALDDVALEFRSVLAEVQYRLEVLSSARFKGEPMVHKDFRDQLLSNKKPDHEKILGYVLDFIFPIEFKSSTTQQLEPKLVFNSIDQYFKAFFDLAQARGNQKTISIFGLSYKNLDSKQLAHSNKIKRQELAAEAQSRGARDILDYLQKNLLTEEVTSQSVRTDGRFNSKSGGPSPRTGGGSP